jgi:hypothetical protein
MKVIWEVEDIRLGCRYTKKDTEEVWIIGYRADADDFTARYVSISESNWMVTSPYKLILGSWGPNGKP